MEFLGNMVGVLLGTMVVLFLIVPILVILAAGALLFVAAAFPTTVSSRKTFRCPWTKRVVTADFVVPEGAAHPSKVVSCTAFPDPQKIACKKACRELVEVRWGMSRMFPRWALTADRPVTWWSPTESSLEGGRKAA